MKGNINSNNKHPEHRKKKRKKIIEQSKRRAPKQEIKKTSKKRPPKKRVPPKKRSSTHREVQLRKKAQREREKQRRMLLWRCFQLTIALLCVSSITFLWQTIYKATSAPRAQYIPIDSGVLDTSTRLSGVVIRDEELIGTMDTGGVFLYQAKEGGLVNTDDPICITTNHGQLYELQKQKESIDEQIFRLEKVNLENSYFYDDIYFLDQKVHSSFQKFYSNSITEKTTNNLRNALNDFAQQRIGIYVKDSFDVTKELKLERSGIVKRMQPMQIQNLASGPGRISYYTDYLEDDLNAGNLSKISKNDYEKALNRKATNLKEQPKQTLTGEKTPIYRLVKSDTAYVLALTSYETALEFQEGEEYSFNYGDKNEKTIRLKLIESTRAGKTTKLLFENSTNMPDLINMRSIELVQSKAAASGLIVPASAITRESYLEIPAEYITFKEDKPFVTRKSGDVPLETEISLDLKTDTFGYLKISPNNLVKVGGELFHPTKEEELPLNTTKDISSIHILLDNNLREIPVNEILTDKTKSVIEPLNNGDDAIVLKQGIKVLTNPNFLQQGGTND